MSRSNVTSDSPTFRHVNDPPFLIRGSIVEWAYNNRSLVILDKIARAGKVYVFDEASGWYDLQSLILPAGVPHRVAMSPDTRMMALSCKDGNSYTTNIFLRIGDYFLYQQTLQNFGGLLDFSGDGTLLVDCATRRAFALSGSVFEDQSTVMVNIPSLIQGQALSAGRVSPFADGFIYDESINRLARGEVDFNNLKITLLTNEATGFDTFHSTIEQVVGDAEVTTGSWPAGGLPLENVQGVDSGPTFDYTADPVSWIVMGSNLFARYGVIYDATSGIPLSFIDFMQDRSVLQNRELIIDFRFGAFLRYSG